MPNRGTPPPWRCTNTLPSYGSWPTPCPTGWEHHLLELSEWMNVAADETPEKYKYLANPSAQGAPTDDDL